MGTELVLPSQTGIALNGGKAGCLAHDQVVERGAFVESVDDKRRCTLNGEIVVLIGVDEGEGEVLAHCQVLVELIFWRDGKYNQTVAQ